MFHKEGLAASVMATIKVEKPRLKELAMKQQQLLRIGELRLLEAL